MGMLGFTTGLTFTIVCIISSVNSTVVNAYEDFSYNPFNGTILERYVNFRFRLSGSFKVIKKMTVEENAMIMHEPMIFNRFDWIFAHGADQGVLKNVTADPRSVLIDDSNIHSVVESLRKVPTLRPHQQRVLVIAGEDTHLSVLANANVTDNDSTEVLQNFYSSRFSNIFFEGTDIRFLNFKTVPMGYTSFYVLQPTPGLIQKQIEAATLRQLEDKQLVFAAWGHVWAHLDKSIKDRTNLARFLKKVSWVSRLQLSFDEYWSQLGNYKFALCPHGAGIQAPKIFESLVLRVVPVVTRIAAFEDLVELGFPILIIETWEQELSEDFLQQTYKEKFLHVDWAKVDQMITVDGVWSMLMNDGTYPF